MGGGISFGGRIQPVSWIQIIPGATAGFWGLFESGYEERYYYNYYYDYYNYYYRYEYFAWGGPFVKLLFGKNKFWGEVSYRQLFGTGFASQVMFGFTYAPPKK